MQKLRRLLPLALLVAGCEQKLVGPAPTLSGVTPAAVCQAQLTTEVILSGEALSPVSMSSLADERLELPKISLVPVGAVAGHALPTAEVSIPDDPKAPEGSRVRWESQKQLAFEVFPELELAPGLYDIRLSNPNGAQTTLAGSLVALAPPAVTAVVPELLCSSKANAFTLEGSGFIRKEGLAPKVHVGDVVLEPEALSECVDVPGMSGLQTCAKVHVAAAANIFQNAAHLVKVVNPEPVGCESLETVRLTAVPEPTLAAVTPDLVCTAQGDNALVISGADFLTVEGVTPELLIVQGGQTLRLETVADASTCVAVEGPLGEVKRCSRLTAALLEDALLPETYAAFVENPAPAGCVSAETISFTVTPPPLVTSIVPDLACTAEGSNTLTVHGDHFLTVDGEAPTLEIATGSGTLSLPTMASPVHCQLVGGPVQSVQRCTQLTAVLAQNGLPAGTYSAIVRNPSPAGCVSEAPASLRVVDPPTVTAVTPSFACTADGASTIEVTGTGFLVVDGSAPKVNLGAVGPFDAAVDPLDCSTVSGTTSATLSCTRLTFIVPQDTAAGDHALSVTNPAPASCASAAGPRLTLFGRPEITSVEPAAACYAAGAPVDVVLSGSGFVVDNGTPPTVTIGGNSYASPSASGCSTVSNGSATVDLCDTLTVQVQPGTFSDTDLGAKDVSVQNPGAYACGSNGSATIAVSAPPRIDSVDPTTVCVKGDLITVTGEGFSQSAEVTFAGQTYTPVVNSGGTQAQFDVVNVSTGIYSVTLDNGDGCSATSSQTVQVVEGPQIFFVDPSVIYDGIFTKATVYGTGFTGAVRAVDIERIDPTTGQPSGVLERVVHSELPGRANQVQIDLPALTHAPGTYRVHLTDATRCGTTLENAFVITDRDDELTLTGITPRFGYQGESTGISIDALVDGAAMPPKEGFAPVPRVYLNPRVTSGTPSSVGAVSFVSPTLLNAVVPAGLLEGEYDLIVVNPDGRVGVLQQAFQVVTQPLPEIDSLSPAVVASTSAETFTIFGKNFRVPSVQMRCFNLNGALFDLNGDTNPDMAVVNSFTDTSISATFNASNASLAGCIVRVTNTDQGTFTEYSALTVTNPAFNIRPGQAGTTLNVARRAPLMLTGRATNAARFLYVFSGDEGDGVGLNSVESAPVSLLGAPGAYFLQRNTLQTPRTLAGGTRVGRFLYAAGGSRIDSSSGTPVKQYLTSIERAVVLDPDDRAEVRELALAISEGAGVPVGLYYYRVAAVMSPTDPFNPGGEELPSDPFPVKIPSGVEGGVQVSVFWDPVPGAVGYHVYRSPTPVDDPVTPSQVGQEQRIGYYDVAVSGGASPFFVDDGQGTPQPPTPLPVGSLGVWSHVADLNVAREGVGMAWSPDPSAGATTQTTQRAWLYVLGGRSGTAPTDYLRSYERVGLTIDLVTGAQTLDSASATLTPNALGSARYQLAVTRASNDLNSAVPPGSHYVYALGGIGSGGVDKRAEAALVASNGTGALGAFGTVVNSGISRAGFPAISAGNQIFAFGGSNGAPDSSIESGKIVGAPNIQSFNATAGTSLTRKRYLSGGALFGAYLYVAGGASEDASGNPLVTNTTEYFLW